MTTVTIFPESSISPVIDIDIIHNALVIRVTLFTVGHSFIFNLFYPFMFL